VIAASSTHAVREGVLPVVQQALAEARLAHAAGAGDGDQPVAGEQRAERSQVVVTADQRLQHRRQVGAQVGRCKRGDIGRRFGRCFGVGRGNDRRGRQRREAVAAPRDGGDHVVADKFPQRAHLHRQVVLFDCHAGPDDVEQFVAANNPVSALDQREQDIEGACAQSHDPAIGQQLALGRAEFEAAEVVDGVQRSKRGYGLSTASGNHARVTWARRQLVTTGTLICPIALEHFRTFGDLRACVRNTVFHYSATWIFTMANMNIKARKGAIWTAGSAAADKVSEPR
jgi:hypothetical protein